MPIRIYKPLTKLVHDFIDWFLSINLKIYTFLNVPSSNVYLFYECVYLPIRFTSNFSFFLRFLITFFDVENKILTYHFSRTTSNWKSIALWNIRTYQRIITFPWFEILLIDQCVSKIILSTLLSFEILFLCLLFLFEMVIICNLLKPNFNIWT